MMNLLELKESLSTYGVNSNTPGLRGDERRRALQERLDQAIKDRIESSNKDNTSTSDGHLTREVVNNLTMTELRRELEYRQDDISTPGLKGMDRKEELKQRLLKHVAPLPTVGSSSRIVRRPKSLSMSDIMGIEHAFMQEDQNAKHASLDTSSSHKNHAKEGWGDDSTTPKQVASRKHYASNVPPPPKPPSPPPYEESSSFCFRPSHEIADTLDLKVEIVKHTESPSKQRQRKRNAALRLKEDIEQIRQKRVKAVDSKIAESKYGSSSILSQNLQVILDERKRILAEKCPTCYTNLIDGTLQEYSKTDLIPLLSSMEEKLRQRLSFAQDYEIRIGKEEREDSSHGITAEREKMAALRQLEEELGEHILDDLKPNRAVPPLRIGPHPPSKFALHSGAVQKPDEETMDPPQRKRRMSMPNSIRSLVQNASSVGLSSAEQLGKKAFYFHTIRKEKEKAQDLYREALRLDPSHGVNLGNYALFLQVHMQDHDQADEHFLKAIKVDPQNVTNISNYANFLKRVRFQNKAAEEYYQLGLRTNPKHVGNLGNYANFLRQAKNDHVKAEQYYLKAIDLDPKHGNILAQYASLLSEKGDLQTSNIYFQRALEVEIGNANIMGNYANLLKKMNKLKEAKDMYLKAMAIDRNNHFVARNYAIFLRDCPSMRTGIANRINMHPDERRRVLSSRSDNALSVMDELSSSGILTNRSISSSVREE